MTTTWSKRDENNARRIAARAGLAITKSRAQQSMDNYGAFMLFDPSTNQVVDGLRHELTPPIVQAAR